MFSDGTLMRRPSLLRRGLDGDAIVARVEDAVLDENVVEDSGSHPSLFGPCVTMVTRAR